MIVRVDAGAVLGEPRAWHRLHELVAAVEPQGVQAEVVLGAHGAVEAGLVGRGVAEAPARAVALEAHGGQPRQRERADARISSGFLLKKV